MVVFWFLLTDLSRLLIGMLWRKVTSKYFVGLLSVLVWGHMYTTELRVESSELPLVFLTKEKGSKKEPQKIREIFYEKFDTPCLSLLNQGKHFNFTPASPLRSGPQPINWRDVGLLCHHWYLYHGS